MKAVVHFAEDVAMLLRRGLSPITDNRNALLALGFERAYPHVRSGYEATIWERSIEHGRLSDGHLVLARQRAFLLDTAA